ncbi:hypothetical protein ACLB2K_044937 [Fragaria x ananassa]
MTDKNGRRHTGTKKSDCPFRLTGKKLDAGDEWQLKVVEGKHNHEAEDSIGKQGHSFQGRLSQEEKSLVKDWRETGKQPKEILEDLKKRDKHNKSTDRTIYNECQSFKRIKRFEDQSSQVQQLMSRAEKRNFIEKHRRTSPNMDTASDLFLTHRTSLELLLAFPTVLKIHIIQWEERLPSWTTLEIVGVTSTDINFFVALAISSSRDGSSYEWALSSLRGVMNGYGIAMPDVVILETWGDRFQLAPMKKVVNDVFSTAKVLLYTDTIYHWGYEYAEVISKLNHEQWGSFRKTWKLLVASPTEADLYQHIEQLRTESRMDPKAAEFVIDTVLTPYKEMFVAAWTDKFMHFGSNKWTWWGSDYIDMVFKLLTPCLGVEQPVLTGKFWNDLQGLIENDNAKVKASLKKSLEYEYKDQYGFPELKELYGTISMHALRLIREQTIVARGIDVDNGENCHCAITSTHGLPCAHQIAKHRREGRPIPPERINSHWRTLQLRETGEPSVEGRVKRRKLSDKKNTDTHFVLPLPDDIVESERNSPNAGPSIVPSTQDRQPDVEVDDIPSTMQLDFADICPPEMRPYILDVKDVPRDGHCGFRAIASFMGYSEDVGWVKVREDLTNELLLNDFHYAQLFGSDQRVNELHDALACSESICSQKHWMTMPDMGHIIASCYNIVLIHLSSAQCFTFFPLRTAPISISISSPIEIVVGFVDDHFMQVYLKNGHPTPPPIRAPTRKNPHLPTMWESFHEQRSTEWATPYLSRIEHFTSLQPEVVSQKNPIPVYLDLNPDPNLSSVKTELF